MMELPLAAPNLFIFEYVLPLFIGPEPLNPTIVEGTAFGIGGSCFVTAAHCIREGMKAGWIALGTTDGGAITVWDIIATELMEAYDLAVLAASPSVPVKCFKWHDGQLPMAASVIASGYPYAMEPERGRMGIRTFMGHVVSATTFGRLPVDPSSYELSFQCPRGSETANGPSSTTTAPNVTVSPPSSAGFQR